MRPKFKVGDILIWKDNSGPTVQITRIDHKDYYYNFLQYDLDPNIIGKFGSWSITAMEAHCYLCASFKINKIWRELNV